MLADAPVIDEAISAASPNYPPEWVRQLLRVAGPPCSTAPRPSARGPPPLRCCWLPPCRCGTTGQPSRTRHYRSRKAWLQRSTYREDRPQRGLVLNKTPTSAGVTSPDTLTRPEQVCVIVPAEGGYNVHGVDEVPEGHPVGRVSAIRALSSSRRNHPGGRSLSR